MILTCCQRVCLVEVVLLCNFIFMTCPVLPFILIQYSVLTAVNGFPSLHTLLNSILLVQLQSFQSFWCTFCRFTLYLCRFSWSMDSNCTPKIINFLTANLRGYQSYRTLSLHAVLVSLSHLIGSVSNSSFVLHLGLSASSLVFLDYFTNVVQSHNIVLCVHFGSIFTLFSNELDILNERILEDTNFLHDSVDSFYPAESFNSGPSMYTYGLAYTCFGEFWICLSWISLYRLCSVIMRL